MILKKLKIENFLSFSEEELDFEKYKGITIIEGRNLDTGGSNGSGKSSIFEAIYFALSGKTLRKTNEEGLVNYFSGKGCKVVLELEQDGQIYRIERGRRPSFLYFYLGDVEITKQSVKDTQSFINKTFSIDENSLAVSMVYGQHNHASFLESSPEVKRKILNSYLSLEEIFKLRDIATDKKRTYTAEVKYLEKDLEKITADLEKEENTPPVEEPKYNLDEIIEWENKIKKHQAEIEKVLIQKASLGKQLTQLKKAGGSCYACHRPFESEEELKKLTEDKEALEIKIEEKASLIAYHENCIRNLGKPPITSSELHFQISTFEFSSDSSGKHVSYLRECKENTVSKLVEAKKKLDGLNFWQQAFSEKGIVRYLIRGILNKFNQIASNYLKILTDGSYDIVFDDQLNETIFNNNNIVAYNSLSGGEKNKIDFATLLSLQQLPTLVDRADINVILFDEVGGFLDEVGIQNLYILLQEMSKSKDLFIITHNKKLQKLMVDYPKLLVEKEKGQSRIIKD